MKTAVYVLSILAAVPALARAVLEWRAARRPAITCDTPLAPLRLVGLTSPLPSHPTAADISTSRWGYIGAAAVGLLIALGALITLFSGASVSLVDDDNPSDAIELSRWLLLLPVLSGSIVAWWGARLGAQVLFQKEGEPAISHEMRLDICGDADTFLGRCQAAFVEIGALRPEGTAVSLERSKDGVLRKASFLGLLRPHEEISLEATSFDDCCYSVLVKSSSYKPRLRTRRFKEDVAWVASRLLA